MGSASAPSRRSARRPASAPVAGGVVGALVGAAHPGPTVAVTALSAAYAVSAALPPGRVLLVTAAVLAGQLSIGWSNDLLDARRDAAVARTDKPIASGALPRRTAEVACALAVLAAVVLSLAAGWVAALFHLVTVGSGWAYNLGLKSTPWSWAAYAAAFGALPVFLTAAGLGQALPPVWVPVAGALLGVGAHLVNVVPDLDDDARTGVRGLPHLLGERRSRTAAVAALLAATLVLLAGSRGSVPLSWTLLVLALGLVLAVVAVVGRGRLPFRAAIGIACLGVALLVLGR